METWNILPFNNGEYRINIYGDLQRFAKDSRVDCKKVFASRGYLKYRVCGKNISIHRLMGFTFLGLELLDKKTLVLHRDDNKRNNVLTNLFLGTAKDNTQDSISKGRRSYSFGTKNGQSKLTEFDVLLIKKCISEGITQSKIGEMFNVCHANISAIKRGITRKTNYGKSLSEEIKFSS